MYAALRPLEELFENKPKLGYRGFSHNIPPLKVVVVSGI
jgi:hypothetical protein